MQSQPGGPASNSLQNIQEASSTVNSQSTMTHYEGGEMSVNSSSKGNPPKVEPEQEEEEEEVEEGS